MIAFDGGNVTGAASRWSPPARCFRLAGASADVRQGKQDAPKQLEWAKTTLESAGLRSSPPR
jgi:hypothetical protein